MRDSNGDGFTDFNASLARLIHGRQGDLATKFLFHHPDEDFARTFNSATIRVDGHGIDRVYVNTKRTLAMLIDAGDIRDLRHLRKAAASIVGMNGFHHEYLAARRNNPVLPMPPGEDAAEAGRLFTDAVDVAVVATDNHDTSERAEWAEVFAMVLGEARALGRLSVRVLHLYRRYEYEFDKTHGAGVYLARRAVLDKNGRVVDFRPWRVPVADGSPPSKRVERQVRKILEVAFDRLRIVAQRLGYKVV